MMKFKRLLMLWLLLSTQINAKDANNFCDIQIAFYPLKTDLHEQELLIESHETSAIYLRRYQKTKYIHYKGSKELNICLPQYPNRPKSTFILKENIGKIILFIDVKNENQIYCVTLKDDRIYRPNNTLCFFNLSGKILYAEIENDKKTLKKGINNPILFGLKPKQIELSVEHNGKKLNVFSRTWRIQKNSRKIIIILPPKEKNSLRIQCIHLTDNEFH